ncbi:MAG: catalase family protein [Pseudomonadota bacterium]
MSQRTNIVITLTIAIIIAMVFYFRGESNLHPTKLATETVPEDEAMHIARAVELFKAKLEKRDANSTLVQRGAHPKQHGCVQGVLRVVSNLDESLITPLFQPGAEYPAWIRFSNNDDPGPDTGPDVRGMAIKLFDVPGDKYTGTEPIHDLLLVSHPVFLFKDVKTYVRAFDAFSKKHVLRFFFNPLNPQIKAFQIARDMQKTHRDLLGMRWWSMVPYQYGQNKAVKYSARPCPSHRAERHNYGAGATKNFLSERLQESLAEGPACFEFMVQFQNDPKTMPIEDPRVEWDETITPFEPIAQLFIPQQNLGDETQTQFCENFTFNPWRAIEAHRPLGGISRARRVIYEELAAYRRAKNDALGIEPTPPPLFAP